MHSLVPQVLFLATLTYAAPSERLVTRAPRGISVASVTELGAITQNSHVTGTSTVAQEVLRLLLFMIHLSSGQRPKRLRGRAVLLVFRRHQYDKRLVRPLLRA